MSYDRTYVHGSICTGSSQDLADHRAKMRLTHLEFYALSTYISTYLTTALPSIPNKYNSVYVWIPRWLWHVERYVYLVTACTGAKRSMFHADQILPVLKCLLYIYEDEDLRVKYSTLHALYKDCDLGDELRKDLKGMQCQMTNCSSTE